MRCINGLGVIALLYARVVGSIHATSFDTHDYYALHLAPSTTPSEIATALNLAYEGQLGELKDHYIFSTPRQDLDVVKIARDQRRKQRKRDVTTSAQPLDGILFSQKQMLKRRLVKRAIIPSAMERAGPPVGVDPPSTTPPMEDAALVRQKEIARSLGINDPIFGEQWHLYNPIQLGHDVNVTGVWQQGITGQNTTVAIVDDGIDMYSEDLKENYFAEGSYDFNDKGPEPKPRLSDDKHGTRCAGEIAAVKNDVCGVGVAWDAKVAGIRILSKQISDADEALAMNYAYQKNHIYSCSWGPPDDGQFMEAPGILIKRAMVNGVQNGRGGKGSIYVFASGNGAARDDDCNFDGYTNSIYSITIGAIDRKGFHPYYSEPCSAQLVVTYSSGSGDAIHTTDVGANKCYSMHGGTSAAAPIAVGIFALVLSLRPDLGWRDLQYLTMQTAVPVNDGDGDWQETPIGKKFSHKYGYGKLDAYAIVEAAKDFKSVKPQAWYSSPWLHVKHDIPQGDKGLASTVSVTQEELEEANLERLEHITVTMNLVHGRRGDVSVELRSPEGMVSHLSKTRRDDTSVLGYADWTFMSVAHWGERGVGDWTIIVKDENDNEFNGSLTDWKLTLWGESINAARAVPLPMPTEHDDDDHDATTTVSATTTAIESPSSTKPAIDVSPTDHPDRPVNEKPSSTTTDGGATPTAPSSGDGETTATPTPTSDHFLPSFFPTFGVSKRTQIWIYGSVGIIAIFCAALGTYFYMARRKRLRNIPRDDYEFDALDDGDGRKPMFGGTAGGRSRRRAGELYDAFAGESDEELLSEEEEGYRDDDGGSPTASGPTTSGGAQEKG
ncbi:MAG: pheromone processing endoprotease [Caeruleum heppii]|nr:MAG: pheromone processing endoprotease [Caeruleum heppii]